MTPEAVVLLGMTALVGGLVGFLVFAILRLTVAARDARRGFRGEEAGTTFMSTALQDAISALRAKEREMTERADVSERLGQEIIESMTSGLLVVDADGVIRTLNPAARRILQIGEQGHGQPYQHVLRSVEPMANVIRDCLTRQSPITRLELSVPRPSGTTTHLGVSISLVQDPGGMARGAICLFTDLSNVIELEEQLKLRETLSRLGELTAGIAHEFRNGLATIHGYSRLLDPAQLPVPYRSYVEGIRQEVDSLGKVVTNFLNFAKPTPLTLLPVDLRALLERVAEELAIEFQQLQPNLKLAGDFGLTLGDEVLLRQAFVNLLRNAIEAAQPTGRTPEVRIRGNIDLGNGLVLIRVSDNGEGVAELLRERVFQPFFTTKPQGTGLGLAIVQKIIVTHDGRVSLEPPSEANGSSFLVVLPSATTLARSAELLG